MKRSGSSDSLEFATSVLTTTVPSPSSTQRQSNGRQNLSRSNSLSSSKTLSSSCSSSSPEPTSTYIEIPIEHFTGEPKQDVSSKSSGAFAHSSSSNYPSANSTITEAAAAVAQTVARLRSQDHLAMLSSEDSVDSSPPPSTPKSRAEWLARRRERFLRSRTNPDIFASMDASDRAKLKASTNTPSTQTAALSARVQQLLSELEFKNALADNSTTSPSPRSNGTRVDEPETSTGE